MSMDVTAFEKSRCLSILLNAHKPLKAIDIAQHIGIYGQRETLRRRVRRIVQTLRNEGVFIVAANPDGYWLTEDQQLWIDYLEGRVISSKRCIGDASRKKRMVSDVNGQGLLFVHN
ncbi:hypothetical protein ACQ9LF_06130 [Anaerohalosphaeraceae bacterium U12dextr]